MKPISFQKVLDFPHSSYNILEFALNLIKCLSSVLTFESQVKYIAFNKFAYKNIFESSCVKECVCQFFLLFLVLSVTEALEQWQGN